MNFTFSYAKLGAFSDTVKYLTRREDAACLQTAAEIALLYGDNILSKSLAEEAVIVALKNSKYNLVQSIITKFSYLKVRLYNIFFLHFTYLISTET